MCLKISSPQNILNFTNLTLSELDQCQNPVTNAGQRSEIKSSISPEDLVTSTGNKMTAPPGFLSAPQSKAGPLGVSNLPGAKGEQSGPLDRVPLT